MKATLLHRSFFALVLCGAFVAAPAFAETARLTMEIKPSPSIPDDPNFRATQTAILTKNEILFPVIQKLGLDKAYAKAPDEVARQLKNNIAVNEIRDTSLIQIAVTDTDLQRAADIATAIAKQYQEMRIRNLRTEVEQRLAEMKDELRGLEERTAAASAKMTELRKELGVIDPDPESINAVMPTKNFAAREAAMDEQAAQVQRLDTQVQTLKALPADLFRDTLAALKIKDPVIEHVLPRLSDLAAEEARLLATGAVETDAQIRGLRAERESFRQTIRERSASLLQAQEAALKIEQQSLANAREELAKEREQATRRVDQRYVEAKSYYLMTKALMQTVKQRYAAKRFDAPLNFEPVKIWELPDRTSR